MVVEVKSERRAPPDSEIKRLVKRYPFRSNQEWASEWGVSRERVRQLRARLGLQTASDALTERRALTQAKRAKDRERLERKIKPTPCPVCGGPVPGTRQTTCSPGCAKAYSGNSKYRYKPKGQNA